jgi:hypothetical protein
MFNFDEYPPITLKDKIMVAIAILAALIVSYLTTQ